MLGGGLRIVQEAQRDPAGGELVLGVVVAPCSAAPRRARPRRRSWHRRCRAACARRAGARSTIRRDCAAAPRSRGAVCISAPASAILSWRRSHCDLREDVAGVAARRRRHRVELAPWRWRHSAAPRCAPWRSPAGRRRAAWRRAGRHRGRPWRRGARSMRALSSARVSSSPNRSSACASSSCENESSRQASRTSACAPARSPSGSSARASAKRPLALSGLRCRRNRRARSRAGALLPQRASARRRNVTMLGQPGLAAMKAL